MRTPTASRRAPRVLIMDDNEHVSLAMNLLLEREGFEVAIAPESGARARAATQASRRHLHYGRVDAAALFLYENSMGKIETYTRDLRCRHQSLCQRLRQRTDD